MNPSSPAWEFARFSGPQPPPNPHELHVRLASGESSGLTRRALEDGPAAFVGGTSAGPFTRLVLPAEPTLDATLAAAVLTRRLAGGSFPQGTLLGHYVELLARGEPPTSSVPVHLRVETYFDRLRTRVGRPLTERRKAEQFLAGWATLETVLIDALYCDADPFNRTLFPEKSVPPPDWPPHVRKKLWWWPVIGALASAVVAGAVAIPFACRPVPTEPTPPTTQPDPPRPADPSDQWAKDGVVTRAGVTPKDVNFTADELAARKPVSRPLDGAGNRAIQLWLEAGGKTPPAELTVQWPDRSERLLKAGDWSGQSPQWVSLPVTLKADDPPSVRLTYHPPADSPAEVEVTVRWRPAPPELHLHVLTIGVSNYVGDLKGKPLKGANGDAEELARAFRALQGPLFSRVSAETVVDATSDELIRGVRQFAKRVREAKQRNPAALQLAVVAYSGHGFYLEDERFIFTPKDYSAAEGAERTAVTWAPIGDDLRTMRCPTVVLLDCCHSGAVARAAEGDDTPTDAIRRFAEQEAGVFILAAAERTGRSFEVLERGIFTGEVLKVLQGKAGVQADGLVTLHTLHAHLETAVPARAKGYALRQFIVPVFPAARNPSAIPLAYFPPKAKAKSP